MNCITTFDLREKDVINVCTGHKLGKVSELELDCDCGRVTAVIVAPDGFCAVLFSRSHVRIPWDKITKIGRDAILVEAPPMQEKDCCDKKWWRR